MKECERIMIDQLIKKLEKQNYEEKVEYNSDYKKMLDCVIEGINKQYLDACSGNLKSLQFIINNFSFIEKLFKNKIKVV